MWPALGLYTFLLGSVINNLNYKKNKLKNLRKQVFSKFLIVELKKIKFSNHNFWNQKQLK